MHVETRRAARPRLRAALPLILGWIAFSGCGSGSTLDRAGVALEPPEGWAARPVSEAIVPGTALASWSGPDGSTFTVLTSLPIPRPSASSLAAEVATRLTNLPGVHVESSRSESVAGLDAARIESVASGNGGSFAPSGLGAAVSTSGQPLIPTRRVQLSIPRQADTLTLLWYYPDRSRSSLEPAIDATIRSLKIRDAIASISSY